MKRLGTLLTSGALLLMTLPAHAQQQTPSGPGPMYGYHHMWGGGWGWHPGIVIAPFILLLAVIGFVAMILWLVRWASHGGHHHWFGHGVCPHCGHGHERSALDILEQRFARGEIDKAEFEEKRKLLTR